MTLKQAAALAVNKLKGISDAPYLDAERLLLFVLRQSESSWLHGHANAELSESQTKDFQDVLDRRLTGEPLAYIIGFQEFYGRTYFVNSHVLIPRPSTEELIDKSLPIIRKVHGELGRPLVVADIGTGSGCIAITLAIEASHALKHIYAIDISTDALSVARQNINHYGLHNIITLKHGSMLQPLEGQHIDLIVSNPPYVPSGEIRNINAKDADKSALRFEPKLALDGGANGLRYIEEISASGTPAILESIGGQIIIANIKNSGS